MAHWMTQRTMTPAQYAWAIRQLGLNKAQAGRFLGVSARTSHRYFDGHTVIPEAHAMLLRAVIHHNEQPIVPPWERGQN